MLHLSYIRSFTNFAQLLSLLLIHFSSIFYSIQFCYNEFHAFPFVASVEARIRWAFDPDPGCEGSQNTIDLILENNVSLDKLQASLYVVLGQLIIDIPQRGNNAVNPCLRISLLNLVCSF